MKRFIYALASVVLLSSCEKVIDVELKKEEPMIVFDAFINNDNVPQMISLQYSQPYFDENPTTPILGASVEVISSEADTFKFVDINSNGIYVWNQTPGKTLCKVGKTYRLKVNYGGTFYEAVSTVGVVPTIDSLTFAPAFDIQGNPDGFEAQFFATDPANQFDFCRIKTYKNSKLFNNSSDLNLSVNGGQFYPGADGKLFIPPVRTSINRFGESYQVNDTVKVELLSISRDTWYYFSEIREQINNQGLFATPTANIRTNIINTNGSGTKAQGWFCASALSRKVAIVK